MLKEKYNQYSLILDRTARRVKQFAQSSFSEQHFDITVDQWVVMKTLYEHENLTQKELAEKCGKDQPTLTRIVDLIIKKGYAQRYTPPEDRRCMFLKPTEEGIEKVKSVAPKVAKIRMKAWDNLTEQDFENFTRILNTIYNNLEIKK